MHRQLLNSAEVNLTKISRNNMAQNYDIREMRLKRSKKGRYEEHRARQVTKIYMTDLLAHNSCFQKLLKVLKLTITLLLILQKLMRKPEGSFFSLFPV